jgi:2-polyprenyl-3-methyl-5-hydroxy-6-metoxy-1,4-benzoquinol methylase
LNISNTNFRQQKKWWEAVGNSPDIEGTKGHIWTPYFSGEKWEASPIYEPHLKMLKESIEFNKVLDFGCGLGRNFATLGSLFKEVYGFDTCGMINKVASIHDGEGLDYEQLTCDWDVHKNIVFDCVFECTVFQHIPTEELRSRLEDISRMTNYLIGTFRTFNDEGRSFRQNIGGYNMMQLIEETERFDIIGCSITPWTASTLMDDTHYEVLLKSK